MKTNCRLSSLWPIALAKAAGVFALLLSSAGGAMADVVVIEAMNGTSPSSVTPFPPYGEIAPQPWSSSNVKSSAPGTTSSRFGSRFVASLASGPPSFKLQPTLSEAGGTYYVETTR